MEYIETFRRKNKLGRYYYFERWKEHYYENGSFKEKIIHSGICKKMDFEDRMQRRDLIVKYENSCLFQN